MARWLALALALGVFAVTLRFNTFAAGGSDSYCYVEQAERWAAGTMTAPVAPGESFPWRDVPLSLAPTGFVPSRLHERAIAPICPSGLSLAMALPLVAGLPRDSVFAVVPLFAGLATWSLFLVGRRLASGWVALFAAVVASSAPIFVFQAIQPMSDVPAAALWLLAVALAGRTLAGDVASGVAVAGAILVRPNLAPLAGVIGLYILLEGAGAPATPSVTDGGATGTHWRRRARRAMAFAAGVVPGVIGVLWVNRILYGSPFSSGYGSLDVLFTWRHVVENLSRYPLWAVTTVSPLVVAACAAPWVVRDRHYAWMLLVFCAGVIALYLPYVAFDNWTYLRFLLPAVPLACVMTVAVVEGAVLRVTARRATTGVQADGVTVSPGTAETSVGRGLAAAAIVAVAWTGFHLWRADALDVVGVTRQERRFIVTGRFAGDALSSDAVVLTIWQSGSVRYYGNRLTVVWDALAPEELDPAIDALAAQGRDAVLVLDSFERDLFRSRFGGRSRFADLDWPPMARIGQSVTVWRFTDKGRYDAGQKVDTLLVR